METIPLPPQTKRLFCGALKRDGQTTCRKPAGHGTPHLGYGPCKTHGGNTRNHLTAAALAQARTTASLYGIPREIHPLDGLMEEYWRTAGLVDVYEAMCVQLLPKEVVWGVQSVEESNAVPHHDADDGDPEAALLERKTKTGAGVNIWVKLFNEERDRFSSLGERILKLDLASRQLHYTQSQVAAMVTVLLSPDLALTEDQRRAAARLLRGMEPAQVTA